MVIKDVHGQIERRRSFAKKFRECVRSSACLCHAQLRQTEAKTTVEEGWTTTMILQKSEASSAVLSLIIVSNMNPGRSQGLRVSRRALRCLRILPEDDQLISAAGGGLGLYISTCLL